MRTIETKIYTFAELSDEAKEKAIQNLSDINVNFQWWESTYEDAKNIGLNITSFDLDRNRHAKGEFISYAYDCAKKIVSNHGKDCETYKTAETFIFDYDSLVKKYSDGIKTNVVTEENEYYFYCDCEELEAEFLRSILEDYSIILQNECEYLQSDEAIIQTIGANEYEFTEDGNQI